MVALQREELLRRFPLFRRINSALYYYKTRRWRWHPRFRQLESAPEIDRPIFLLGTQGGGLTLISRILRRIPGVATGNHRYWAGYDEMQDVLYDVLPPSLRLHGLQNPFSRGGDDRFSWLYASSVYFGQFHQTAEDYSLQLKKSLRSAIRGLLHMNAGTLTGSSQHVRFLDKSQSYTIRIGLVSSLLRKTEPRFVLITRDPYAMCWRAVQKVRSVVELDLTPAEKLKLAAEHWANSMATALHHSASAQLRVWRFEDFLHAPDRVIREVCDFVELPYSPAIMPSSDDRIPWGSMWDAFNRAKWYPIRRSVNEPYLEKIPVWAVEFIESHNGELARQLGYSPPSLAGHAYNL